MELRCPGALFIFYSHKQVENDARFGRVVVMVIGRDAGVGVMTGWEVGSDDDGG